jgi:hypothetical protein
LITISIQRTQYKIEDIYSSILQLQDLKIEGRIGSGIKGSIGGAIEARIGSAIEGQKRTVKPTVKKPLHFSELYAAE